MNHMENIYEGVNGKNAETNCYSIFNLCKIGLAANDSIAGVDLSKGGYDALFESIAALAWDAIETMEAQSRD